MGSTKERSNSLPSSSSSSSPSSASPSPSPSPSFSAASADCVASSTSAFSPTLLTLVEQLTPSLHSASSEERLRVLTRALQESIATAILFPASLPSPQPTPSLPPPPLPSAPVAVDAVAAPSPMKLPPPSIPPSRPLSSSSSSPRSASFSLSLPSASSPLPPSSSPSPSPAASTPGPSFSSLRGVCDLLLLSYIDALSRTAHSLSPPSSASSASDAAATSFASSSLSLAPLSLPPSSSTRAFLSFLRLQPHFATTSAFSSLLGHFATDGGRGLLFLLSAAQAHRRMAAALTFIAAHALPHVTPALTAFLVSSSSHQLLLSSIPGSAIFRCLPAPQRLELLLLLLLSPLPSLSSLSVLAALDELLPRLDVHGLYRVCTMLDPSAGTVPLKGLDNFARILVVEMHILAVILIRSRAVEREAQRGGGGGSDELDDDDEELSYFTAERLHTALLLHRGAYRQWRVLSFLADHGHAAALAHLHETNQHWTDAFELRIRLARTAHATHTSTTSASTSAAQPLLLHLLRTHVQHVPSGVERARLLGLLILAWRDCGLQAELLEAEWMEDIERWAESLCILLFAPPHSVAEAIPAWTSSSGAPPSFSPRLRLQLTSHRLQRLHLSHSSSLSSSLPVASPRLWHEVLSRMYSTVTRRSHLIMHQPLTALDVDPSHSYEQDELLAFTCGHCVYVHDLYEAQLPMLLSRLRALDVDVTQLMGWLEAEYGKELVRLACPACVWSGLQAEASRLAQTVARVVHDGAGQASGPPQQGAAAAVAHSRGRHSGGSPTSAGRADGPFAATGGGGGGGGGSGGGVAGAMEALGYQRSPHSSPTSSRAQSSASTPRDRAAKLETWR